MYRVGIWGFRVIGLFCDNDLVDGKNGVGCFGCEVDGLVFGGEEVEDVFFFSVEDFSVIVVLES